MSRKIFFLSLISFFLLIQGCKTGCVSGKVTFHGVPCGEDEKKEPPCQGPYPGYTVDVYSKAGQEILKTTTTNGKGAFCLKLQPGEYVIYTQDGISPENKKTNSFKVEKSGKTEIDLEVDTGIQ